eukprot:6643786-Ditylum_brightwellii.AAC.1
MGLYLSKEEKIYHDPHDVVKKHTQKKMLGEQMHKEAEEGKPLRITSCVPAQSTGCIYIEIHSKPTVMEAVQGKQNLLQYNMKMVPISNMITVMTV